MRHLRAIVLSSALMAAFAAALPLARAGAYMDAVRVQQACRSIAELGASAFAARPSTAAIMDSFELQAAARTWLEQMNTQHPIPAGREGQIIRETAVHAFTRAASAQGAYDYGWARCMDEYALPPFGTVQVQPRPHPTPTPIERPR
jgi:hypothetical protein